TTRFDNGIVRRLTTEGWQPGVARHGRLGRLGLVYGLDAIENLAEIALRDLHVIVVLQVEPKLCGCPERLGEPKRSIGGNAGLFSGDPLDPSARRAPGLGKSARPHPQREEGLLPQNLPRMPWLELLCQCRVLFHVQSTVSAA